jgi:6-phosphogluconate dehydrogenase
VPHLSSESAPYDTAGADRLTGALVQGQAGLFGAHTYRRVDREVLSTQNGRLTHPNTKGR